MTRITTEAAASSGEVHIPTQRLTNRESSEMRTAQPPAIISNEVKCKLQFFFTLMLARPKKK